MTRFFFPSTSEIRSLALEKDLNFFAPERNTLGLLMLARAFPNHPPHHFKQGQRAIISIISGSEMRMDSYGYLLVTYTNLRAQVIKYREPFRLDQSIDV